MHKPLVSVLIPAYNAEQFLTESIESILTQTYSKFELLIADDCSQDQTYQLARSFERKDDRVSVFQHSTNINIAANRNFLVSKARGEYIAWQDADDISLPTRLELQVAYLQKHTQVGLVGGYLQFFNESGNISIRKYAENDEELRSKIFRYSPVAQPVAMIRRSALEYAGQYGVNLSPAEDIDMSFRIGTRYQFANIPTVLLNYRYSSHSATAKRLRKIELVTLAVRARYLLHSAYSCTVMDILYNIAQFLSLIVLPSRVRISLFMWFRNSKE